VPLWIGRPRLGRGDRSSGLALTTLLLLLLDTTLVRHALRCSLLAGPREAPFLALIKRSIPQSPRDSNRWPDDGRR
jgi:hypothetical protein